MKKFFLTLLGISLFALSFSQIDSVILHQRAAHLFPSQPIKSSYTSLFDKRAGINYVYSANMESGLGIYDISSSNSINPVLNLGNNIFNNLDVSTIEQKGNFLYLGIGDFQVNTNISSGLAILDITNPTTPVIKDIWDSTLYKHGISHLIIEGNYAYLSTMTDGIIILDVSNENDIIFKSHLQLDLDFPAPSINAHNARGLKYKNDTLYVCFDRGGLRVIDVTNKSTPLEIYKFINNSLNTQAAAAYNDIAIKGNYAFISIDYCGIEVLDISSIPFTTVQWYNPWGCNNSNWSGADLHTNEVRLADNDSLLFVSAGQSDLFIFDVTNPLNMSKVGEFVNLNDTLATHGLDVWDNKIILSFLHTPFHIPPFTPFFSTPGGLKLLDYNTTGLNTSISDITKAQLRIYPSPNQGGEIRLECEDEIMDIRVFSSLGQLVLMDTDIYKNNYSLNLCAKETGVYLISITTKQGHLNAKISIR